MVKGEGSPRIDGVAIGEVGCNLLSPTVHLTAKYALVNSVTAERFGSGNWSSNWSDETLTKLGELIQSMEQDVCRSVFTDGPERTDEPTPTDGVEDEPLPHLSDEDGIPEL